MSCPAPPYPCASSAVLQGKGALLIYTRCGHTHWWGLGAEQLQPPDWVRLWEPHSIGDLISTPLGEVTSLGCRNPVSAQKLRQSTAAAVL